MEILAAHSAFKEAVGGMTGEGITVACNHKAGFTVGRTLRLSGSQLRLGSGPDGADLALLAVIRSEVVAGRVDQLVIGSGDGLFARELQDIRCLLDSVTVVAPMGSISWELYHFADKVHLLEPTEGEFVVHLEVAA